MAWGPRPDVQYTHHIMARMSGWPVPWPYEALRPEARKTAGRPEAAAILALCIPPIPLCREWPKPAMGILGYHNFAECLPMKNGGPGQGGAPTPVVAPMEVALEEAPDVGAVCSGPRSSPFCMITTSISFRTMCNRRHGFHSSAG